MKPIRQEHQITGWEIAGKEDVLQGHGPRQMIISKDGEKVDSVAFIRLSEDGSLTMPKILRPGKGRENRGVGLIDDCFLVAGQEDGGLHASSGTRKRINGWKDCSRSRSSWPKVVNIKAVR
ncbi:uncharacterized protein IL334_005795 [Kwoniella shivajii]|uniref:Uncharacterized protein n=1 Tax=Kwoniella shivajii TaxID=564305 RepID=A0ABZ1D447_9TREE|nr:hypothetical protein IL334_005795 [Kwoniella shivajii]